MTLKTTDPKRPATKPRSGSGSANNGARSDKRGGDPERSGFGFPKLWVMALVLIGLLGLPRLLGMSEQRVSFDQFVQLVDKGDRKSVV